jgi:hypothetical protein
MPRYLISALFRAYRLTSPSGRPSSSSSRSRGRRSENAGEVVAWADALPADERAVIVRTGLETAIREWWSTLLPSRRRALSAAGEKAIADAFAKEWGR